MNELHWNTISPDMRRVMGVFGDSEIGKHFYLAGGTALALQIGHRLSADLDFFSPDLDIPTARETLQNSLREFSPELADSSWGNLVFAARTVRVGFYGYGYPLVDALVTAEKTSLASISDIGLMKLDVLLSRASRKDFHDLYAICQRMSLRALLDLASRKYSHARDFEAQVVKHLAYFERAEREAPVPLIEEISWEEVKTYFRAQAVAIGKDWLPQ
ncbi:nucleotidyl transferase AbiEii/AbiGii toxin family protein [Chloroflexi bacterium CFX2]|nr:nucleotidyl transferase AbiEii/AbiGii toxin family protein [Chloroflexi bacterium CFX2]